MFYFLWHGAHGQQGPFDISKIMAANPADPEWGPFGAYHHWGEPEMGYYLSTDPYVIRKNASMLADAGVDVIIYDASNGFTYPKAHMQLCEVYQQMRQQGTNTPQFAFLAPFGDASGTVQELYENLYAPGHCKELWFRWEGKPLIMADPRSVTGAARDFFTFRNNVASYFTGPSRPGDWSWLEIYPQHVFYDSDGNAEEMSVGVAQNAANGHLVPMSNQENVHGRSWHDGHKEPGDKSSHYGFNFGEQWERALKVDPEFVFVTGWNEWVAMRLSEWAIPAKTYTGNAIFVDVYNQEYSRDIEPMKGGYTDSYYYQLVANIRRFKGARPPRPASPPKTITIDGRFSEWKSVGPEFRDTAGDTTHRDWPGWGDLHYTNTTGRNDIIASKVARDQENIYFYAETKADLTSPTDPAWMLLFINADLNSESGWQGYDYRINGSLHDSRKTILEKHSGRDGWQEVAELSYRAQNHQLEIKVPRANIDQEKSNIALDFHWADNIKMNGDITEFFTSGDSAPNRRFNYRYEEVSLSRPNEK